LGNNNGACEDGKFQSYEGTTYQRTMQCHNQEDSSVKVVGLECAKKGTSQNCVGLSDLQRNEVSVLGIILYVTRMSRVKQKE
jgi:hypothetical protein